MQDGSWNQPLPISLLLKDPAGGRTLEGDGGVFSEASSDGEHYLDSVTELDSGDGDFADLTAFLSADEINRSLDLAREAFGEPFQSEDPGPSNLSSQEQALQHVPSLPVPPQTTVNLTRSPNLQHQTKAPCPDDNAAAEVSSSQNAPLSKSVQVSSEAPTSTEKVVRHKPIQPVYKQDKPRLVHEGLELNDRASSATEFCSRAATFIEELSSIFKGSAQLEQQGEEDSSSPDSGYLSPRSRRPVPQGSVSAPSLPPSQQAETQYNQPAMTLEPQSGAPMGVAASARYQHSGAPTSNGPLSPPCFLQKLKSQEVAEGSPIRLECRVTGNPLPLVRWFCEGRELHNSPDIQIWRDGNLHTLVITEAFEDDTGRYTCVASNSLGADNTSAEVYIEGQKLLLFLLLRHLVIYKLNSQLLTITLLYVSSLPHHSSLTHSFFIITSLLLYPSSVQLLQDAQASEGQVVVLECRVRGSPPLQVRWYRQGEEILDSPDFRILQKKPRSAAEPEEICTLVIAEAFPEDGGLFSCIASNPYGSINSTARLTVTAGASNTDTKRWSSCCYQAPSGHQQAASITALIGNFFLITVTDHPSFLLLCRNASQLKQLQDQILLEQQEANQEVPPPPQQPPQEVLPPAPPSPPLPPPPSFQELENNTAMQASTFNYARPKQFIAAQSPGGAGYVTQSSGSSGSSLSSPLSPPTSHKPFGRVTVPPFTKAGSVESPSSPSFPPPPPPFLSSSNLSSPSGPAQDFPPPPPPPPLPVSLSPAYSDMSSPFSSVPPSPASSFLSSVLPSTPSSPASPTVNALGLPKGNGTVKAFPRKSSVTRTPRVTSDSDIQGSKDAVIQDLERKLRFKEERISNGQQRLTYEEKMARRLLGADNAATVLNTQDTEEEPVTQVRLSLNLFSFSFTGMQEYKVSSFEQRLISEIEFRLERSPVEESDDDVQHDEDSTGKGVAPTFDQKLKHYKVFEGMPVTFSCKVHGDPKPKVYWFKDGKQISKRSEHYRISRDADGTCSLHTAAASLDDDGNYTIMAGNPEGRVSCTGRMMVQAVNQRGRSQRSAPGHMRRPRSRSRDSGDENDNIQERHFRPHFLQAPGDLIVQEGRLCRMDCKVSGLPTPDLIWQLNGQTIRPDSSHKMLVRENGVHSLVIEPVTSRDAGIYTCIASNRAGQNSFNLELIVAAKEMHKAPSFVEKLQNTSVAEGHPVRLECRVTGVPYPQIFWKRENESFTHNTDRISMHQDNCGYLCMIIQPAMKEDAGWYTVSAKNDAGIVSSTARLDVHAQWQQPNLPKPKKVRPSTSRYAALTERGLDVKAAFFPDSSPLQPGGLVESDDL
uniref:Palladin n=1 Tax=Dicentrarchus labrax TaxID=13489 RepID=A0A8C4ECX7_DICLA